MHEAPSSPSRRRWLLPAVLVLLWLAVGGVVGPLSGKLSSVQKNDNAAFLPSSAESTKVIDEQKAFAAGTSPTPVVLVFERPAGVSAADKTAVAAELARIPGLPVGDNKTVQDYSLPVPLVAQLSTDGKALTATLLLDGDKSAVPLKDGTSPVAGAVKSIRTSFTTAGLDGHVGGLGGLLADLVEVFGSLDTSLLFTTVAVVGVILILVYRSPLLWLVPLIAAGTGLTLAMAVVYLMAKASLFKVNGQSQGILTVLVFGAGTDYALLLVSRYREELRRFESKYEAMRAALRGAVEPIVASAATVAVGLLCLTFSELNSNKATGPIAAVGIACALVVMLTFLPAILLLPGRWLFWPFIPRYGTEAHAERGLWSRVAALVSRRHRISWVAMTVLLGALATLAFTLKANGISQSDSFTKRTDSVVAQDALSRHFPAGSGSPAVIITNASTLGAVTDAVKKVAGVDAGSVQSVADRGSSAPKVVNGRVQLQVVLDQAADSTAAQQTVLRLRNVVHGVPGANALVGGFTAVNLDTEQASRHDRNLIIPIVLVVIFLILALLLRALLAPLLLVASVLLSFFATLGSCAFFFNHVFHFKGADTSFPLFAFTFLVALGVDYNIFLMTRVREETQAIGTRPGTQKALAVTGGVITSAGVVLAATFSVLATLPLVFLAELGFAVAFGVLLDTILVRSILVPALVHDVGKRIWLPSRLSRVDEDALVPAEAEQAVASAP